MPAAAAIIAAVTPEDAKQRFYTDVAARAYSRAIDDGRPYEESHPEDARFLLDYAYAMCNAAQTQAAAKLLRTLATASDPVIAGAARAQLAAISAGPRPARPVPQTVYAYVEPDTRYADTFYGMQVRRDLSGGSVRAFVTADLSSDTRSGAPQTAPVFNTDTLFFGAGLHAALAPGLDVRVMAGPGYGLRGQATETEVRTQASLWHAFGAFGHAQTTVGSSVFYSSRFAGNVMTYTQLQHTMPLGSRVHAIVGVNAATDTKGYAYDNFVEGVAGIEVRLDAHAAIRYEVRHGNGYTAARAVLWFSAGQ